MTEYLYYSRPTFQNQISSRITVSPNGELSRLISAAVVDRKFRELLLENPTVALESNYGREGFCLSSEEKDLVLSVQQPASLADFAMQIAESYAKSKGGRDSSQD
jgi:hypothetical protein